jgi:hypothetical protein
MARSILDVRSTEKKDIPFVDRPRVGYLIMIKLLEDSLTILQGTGL